MEQEALREQLWPDGRPERNGALCIGKGHSGLKEQQTFMDKVKEQNPAKFFENMEFDKMTVDDKMKLNDEIIKKHNL
jgi:hypothetical protein